MAISDYQNFEVLTPKFIENLLLIHNKIHPISKFRKPGIIRIYVTVAGPGYVYAKF